MIRYLLGQSPEEERTRLEERYFSDGAYFDQLLALEDSLIDDFVSGRMPSEQFEAFKRSVNFRKDDVRFTRALIQAATKKKIDQTGRRYFPQSLMQFSPSPRSLVIGVSIVVLLLALSFALYFRSHTLRKQLSENEAQLSTLNKENQAYEQELSEARSQTKSMARELELERNKRIDAENSLHKLDRRDSSGDPSDFITVSLNAAFIPRGSSGAPREVHVSENTRWLRFAITLKGYGEYESYRILIKLAGDNEVFRSGTLKATGSRGLAVTVPVNDLRSGDYILTLYGERPAAPPTEVQRYAFRIKG